MPCQADEARPMPRWAGKRLPPTEWETAADQVKAGRGVGNGRRPYVAYPAIASRRRDGEYNGKFMANQTVLRAVARRRRVTIWHTIATSSAGCALDASGIASEDSETARCSPRHRGVCRPGEFRCGAGGLSRTPRAIRPSLLRPKVALFDAICELPILPARTEIEILKRHAPILRAVPARARR